MTIRGAAAAYGRAAGAVGKLDAAPFEQPAIDAIHTPLARLPGLYAALGSAARRHQRNRYRQVTRRIASARAGVRSGVRQLEALGYKLASPGGGR